MMSDLKILEVLEKYQLSTDDPHLQCAIRAALDWRASAAYYESEARVLRRENQELRDKIDKMSEQPCQCRPAHPWLGRK